MNDADLIRRAREQLDAARATSISVPAREAIGLAESALNELENRITQRALGEEIEPLLAATEKPDTTILTLSLPASIIALGRASGLIRKELRAAKQRGLQRAADICRNRASSGGPGNAWCLDCAEAIESEIE